MSTTNDQMIAGYDYKEWVRLESLFLKDYENSTRYNKPFSALISDVLENETYKSFADKTGLSENMLYRLKKQVDEKRDIRTTWYRTKILAWYLLQKKSYKT